MRISVMHSTVYRYDQPVYLEPHTFRLRPRVDGTQWLHQYLLQVSPIPAGISECLDQDGNATVHAWFKDLTRELRIQSSFMVEARRDNPFDYILTVPPFLPVPYSDSLRAALAPYLGSGTIAEPVRQLAERLQGETGGRTLDFLNKLNNHLSEDYGHSIRAEGLPHPAEFTLSAREGTCRDLTALFCSVCHAAGIAARFVSGYEREAATQDLAYMHAWPEVYLPGGGWRGYDPTQGLAVSQSHVVVAAAADPRLAAPVTGLFRGAATPSMEFSITLSVSE
jgi:transglutaminase-like putative cysteine protease